MNCWLALFANAARIRTWQGLPVRECVLLFVLATLPMVTLGQVSMFDESAKATSPASSDKGWHVDVTPYLWFAGVHGTAGVAGHEVSVHADASDVLSNFNIGFMGVVEPRYDRVLFSTDFMWIKLTDDRAIPFGQVDSSAKAEFNQTIFAPSIGYRIVDAEKVKVDWRMGIRYWHLNSSISLQPPTPGNGFSGTADWVDGVSGGRINALLSRKLSVTIGGDAGGGTARSDYQVYGLLGFRLSKKLVFGAGYRYMTVNYRPQSTFIYDMTMSGMLLGATWNAK